MLHRLTYLQLLVARGAAAVALLFVPLVALAQAAADALPPVTAPTSWREFLWTGLIIPIVGLLFRELQQWLAARRASAQVARDTNQRAFVEDMLFRLVDAVGAPIYADLRGILERATDPTSPGGAAITTEEWQELFDACEEELKALLTPDKLQLVMKTLGLGAAARLIATFVVKRIFAVRQTAASESVPTDAAAALYGVRGAPALEQQGVG